MLEGGPLLEVQFSFKQTTSRQEQDKIYQISLKYAWSSLTKFIVSMNSPNPLFDSYETVKSYWHGRGKENDRFP